MYAPFCGKCTCAPELHLTREQISACFISSFMEDVDKSLQALESIMSLDTTPFARVLDSHFIPNFGTC